MEKSKDLKQNKNDLLNGTFKAICYSGFREGQHPDRGDGEVNPTYQEILEDLEILSNDANFSLIRLYDSGKNSQMVLEVIKENNIDIKVMLGIWLNAELSNHEGCPWLDKPIPEEILNKNKEGNLLEINTAIELANKYQEIIIAVNVGNEALVDWNDHLVSADTIITYVEKVKNSIEQPVTVADNFKWWSQSGLALSKVVDFISIHVYPLWEGQDIDTALAFSIDNIKEVANALPESKIVITEVGWATVASEFGDRASEEKQLRYYNEIMTWAEEMNITTFFFEAFDEPWKGDPNNMMGAEKHWGIYTVDRKPKLVMQ
ncbi:MAG: glycosyl hydrolase [Ignavibacteriales bacterium]|nr:glycosyl hydrolase [Ignavibacteriales bacterium]